MKLSVHMATVIEFEAILDYVDKLIVARFSTVCFMRFVFVLVVTMKSDNHYIRQNRVYHLKLKSLSFVNELQHSIRPSKKSLEKTLSTFT